MKKNEVKIGMKVICVKKEETYYSKYDGNLECFFERGDVGTVVAINKSFVCVDFKKNGKCLRARVSHSILQPIGG